MKTVVITQARYGSSRLPGKVLKKIGSNTLLGIQLHRLKKSQLANDVIVATTNEVEAQEIVALALENDCRYFRGSLDDVLDRFYQAALSVGADVVVRITSDCPLVDASLIDKLIEIFKNSDVDYLSNVHPPTFPDGTDVEVFSFNVLKEAWSTAQKMKEREHVTPYIWEQPEKFKLLNFSNKTDTSNFRLTVDTIEDFDLISHLVFSLGMDKSWEDYVQYLIDNPDLCKINNHLQRNEGYYKGNP